MKKSKESQNLTVLSSQALDLQRELDALGKVKRSLKDKLYRYEARFKELQRAKINIETQIMKQKNEIKTLRSGKIPYTRKSKSSKELNSDLISQLSNALKGMTEEEVRDLINSRGE